MSNELDVHRLNNELIENLFEEAFAANSADRNNEINLTNFEVAVESKDDGVLVVVKVYSFAGETTRQEFHNKENKKIIEGGETIVVKDPASDDMAEFELEDSMNVTSNDYNLYYRVR